jgi:preprotein translocase subunit SecB
MKPSPLTLHGIQFVRVHVETDLESENRADEFEFDGQTLQWGLDHGRDEDNGTWWVAVGFGTHQAEDEPRCPYILDVQAVGIVSVSEEYPAEKHEKLAYEYGAALVYGAIREMVTNITGRSLAGPLVLPTPSFVGALETRESDDQ